jgi:hypothetical protein
MREATEGSAAGDHLRIARASSDRSKSRSSRGIDRPPKTGCAFHAVISDDHSSRSNRCAQRSSASRRPASASLTRAETMIARRYFAPPISACRASRPPIE